MTTKVDNINSQVIKVRSSSLIKITDRVQDRSLPFRRSSGFCVYRTDGKPKRECKDITQDCIVQGLHGRSISHVREPGGGVDKTLPLSRGARNRGLAHTVSVMLSNDKGQQSDIQAEIEREGVVRYQVAAALQKIAVNRTLVNGSI